MKLKAIFLLLQLIICSRLYSQIPGEDPTWILDTQDNFNSFNSALWNSTPNNTWGLETYSASNVSANSGVLTLTCYKNNDSYISGGIETVGKKSFSYGYFEIESQQPPSGIRGPWGGFWLHTAEGGWDEIDILEPNGCDIEEGTSFHSGISATYNGVRKWTTPEFNFHGGFPDLSKGYNKYSAIWTPSKVKMFFNGSLVYEVSEPSLVPSHPMFLFLTFQIDNQGCHPVITVFPTTYWRFKNFKYYKLKTDCTNGITESNFDFTNHDYKVQKYYSLSNSSVPLNSKVFLRATDYIELKQGFIVPNGSEFNAITHCTTCPQ